MGIKQFGLDIVTSPDHRKVRISITNLDDLPKLHKAVASYLDLGYVSENRIMSDSGSWYETLVKE